MDEEQILTAARIIKRGGVVAYPTESCFGLGCDPRNTKAIMRLLRLKKRSPDKGLILISDCFERLAHFIKALPLDRQEMMHNSWPGPVTWLCPAKPGTSRLLTGKSKSLGIRVTAHPVAARLCRAAGMAMVSTSANVATRPSIRCSNRVLQTFANNLDFVVEGPIGQQQHPSRIIDVFSGQIFRA